MNNYGKVNFLVVIIIVLVQFLLFGGLFVWFFVINPDEPLGATRTSNNLPAPTEMTPIQQQQQAPPPPRDDPGSDRGRGLGFGARDFTRDFALVAIGDVIVNPAGADNRFFIVSVSLEHRQADRRLPAEIASKTPLIQDTLTSYFSRLTVEEIRNIDYRETYREDIMRLINGLLMEGRVTNVIFSQWIVQ
jgi:flagellar basal body-associated protein FliL